MQHDIRTLCFDILRAISEIREFTDGLSFEDYCKNRLVKLAVERNYEIIGEALKRMETRFESEFRAITDGRKIIDFRNILAHGYDQIADEIVWAITCEGIDILEKEVVSLSEK
jgi:uncharacterized protein with HEPN domain